VRAANPKYESRRIFALGPSLSYEGACGQKCLFNKYREVKMFRKRLKVC